MSERASLIVRRWRILLALFTWLVAAVAAHAAGLRPGASTLVGWNLACLAYLVPTGWSLLRDDADTVRRRAREEDETRFIILSLVLASVLVSFAAIVVALREAKTAHGQSGWLVFLSISTIVLSWLVVQAIFCLHYAHKYFGDTDEDGKSDRGVQFTGDPPSTYRDFIYISVCLGATYQVSDFALTTSSFRNLVTAHALVAFLFNTLVLALGVNIVGNLMGQ